MITTQSSCISTWFWVSAKKSTVFKGFIDWFQLEDVFWRPLDSLSYGLNVIARTFINSLQRARSDAHKTLAFDPQSQSKETAINPSFYCRKMYMLPLKRCFVRSHQVRCSSFYWMNYTQSIESNNCWLNYTKPKASNPKRSGHLQ